MPVKEFSSNLIFESFRKICRETPDGVKIGQEFTALYMKT